MAFAPPRRALDASTRLASPPHQPQAASPPQPAPGHLGAAAASPAQRPPSPAPPGRPPSPLALLRARFRGLLGPRGHGERLTELQAAVTIAAFLLYRSDGSLAAPPLAPSTAAKARVAALLTGRSAKAAEAQWAKFQAHGRLVLEARGARGPKRAHEAALLAHEATVKEHVRRVLLQQDVPGWVTRRSLQTLLREATGVHAGLPAIARLCKAWGLKYGRLHRPPAAATPKRLLQRDVAVCQLRRALAQGHVILSADESYCNERESREFQPAPNWRPLCHLCARQRLWPGAAPLLHSGPGRARPGGRAR